MLNDAGINSFIGTSSAHGNFWEPYFDLGFPFWPTLEAWFDKLRGFGKTVGFTFDAFNAWADVTDGLESSRFLEYIGSIGRSIRDAGEDQKANTMREAHEFIWRIQDFPTRMRNDDIYIGMQDGNIAVDDRERLILVYSPGRPYQKLARIDIDECDEILGLD